MGDLLQISPADLRFRFELRKNIPVTLTLHNPTEDRVAFKVKTTSPKKYCVRPSSGIVEAGATKEVQVIMQAQREYPPSFADCKDKFLVQAVKIDASVREVTNDTFDTTKAQDFKQQKLRVVLVGPPKPPSPVPEGVEEEGLSPGRQAFKEDGEFGSTPGIVGGGEDGSALTRETSRLKEQLAEVEKDRAGFKKRVDQLEMQLQGRQPPSMAGQQMLLKGGFSLIHLLIVALVAFILGHYIW